LQDKSSAGKQENTRMFFQNEISPCLGEEPTNFTCFSPNKDGKKARAIEICEMSEEEKKVVLEVPSVMTQGSFFQMIPNNKFGVLPALLSENANNQVSCNLPFQLSQCPFSKTFPFFATISLCRFL